MRISLKNILLIGAAVFAAWNLGMVGAFIEGKPAGSVSVGGLFGGAVVSISLAISSANIAAVRGQKRTKYAEGFYFVMLGMSVLSVAVVIWYDLDGRGLHWLPRFFLSIAYPALADIAIATAGNITGKSFVTFGEQANKKTPKTNTRRTKTNKNEQKANETNAKRTETEQNRTQSNMNERHVEQVTKLLKQEPNAPLRRIVEKTAIKSTSTASRYKKYVEEMK